MGFFAPWVVFAGVFGLHLLLPARRVTGYVRDEHSGQLLRYRLNGLLVFFVTVAVWFAAGRSRVMPWDWGKDAGRCRRAARGQRAGLGRVLPARLSDTRRDGRGAGDSMTARDGGW